jgi:uncharacterized protein with HEPN domain
MNARTPLPRLDDMRDAIVAIEEDTRGVSFDEYVADRKLRWSVERGIEIISEASRHIPDDLRVRHPEVPWPKVAAIGNVLRHEYMHVAPDAVWAVIQDHLPILRRAVESMIDAIERGDNANLR